MGNEIRTRIAPSPTGLLHVGTARAALFNELFARQNDGVFVMRIEDTDKERSEKKYEQDIITGLKWLGLKWNEGPDVGGEYGPYRQSEKTARYKEVISELLEKDLAYKVEDGNAIKIKVEAQEVIFEDLIRGTVKIHSDTWGGDFVIARDIDDPVFHLAVAIDDSDQKISHVIRGEDHLTNTARHVLLQQALGFDQPIYAHLPLLLNKERRKLSKREGDVSLLSYKNRGFLPEAMLNYLALLGWNPGNDKEFFTHEELIKEFDIKNVQKGGAIFDEVKLSSMNKHHLEELSDDKFIAWGREGLDKHRWGKENKGRLDATLLLEGGRASSYSSTDYSLEESIDWAHSDWQPDDDFIDVLKRRNKKGDGFMYEVKDIKNKLELLDDFIKNNVNEKISEKKLEEKIIAWIDKEDLGRAEVLWPMRVALTGRENSQGPFEVFIALGKNDSLKRLREAINRL
jgi:glutamyl/glutaminyl-tRNA synthetase